MTQAKGAEWTAAQMASAAEALRRAQEIAQPLYGAPGPKALLRRFGEILVEHFGVGTFDTARLVGRGTKLGLKRRSIRVAGCTPLSDDDFQSLAATARKAVIRELSDGSTDLVVGEKAFKATVVDDARGPSLVIWEPGAGDLGTWNLLLEGLVRVLQNESRWLRKLDRTQAMLYRDDLTGLYNYRYLEIALDTELRRAERFQNQFCLLFIDLDGFKPINDQHGHLSGSSVLKQVADVIRDAVREIDVPIRYGGDEFVILLLGATCAKGVLAAERVRRHVEARDFLLEDGGTARLTCSIGVAAFPEHGRDRETLLKMADETMYNSKRAGKNRVTVVGGREGSMS